MNKKILSILVGGILLLPATAFADNTKIYENEENVEKRVTIGELVRNYQQQKANKDLEINPYYDPDIAGSGISEEDTYNNTTSSATGANLLDEKRRQLLIQKEEEEEIINNEPTIIKD